MAMEQHILGPLAIHQRGMFRSSPSLTLIMDGKRYLVLTTTSGVASAGSV